MAQDWQGRVYAGSSAIDGMGLFAARHFDTGETILQRDESRLVSAANPLDARAGESEHHCDWLSGSRQVYLGFPERFLNHCCDNNAFLRFQDGPRSIVALKPIEAGQEITSHYALNGCGDGSWICRCGSPRCLGLVPVGFFALPLDRQIELSPLLADWYVREHQRDYDALLDRAGLREVVD